jgi:hypothetical protein
MINAALARSYAYKSVGLTCSAEAIDNLYKSIDEMIEVAAKEGKMFVSFYIKGASSKYMKVNLSRDQLGTLVDRIKVRYKEKGFDVTPYSDDTSIEIGWFSL